MRRVEWSTIGIIVLWIIFLFIAVLSERVKAQDTVPSVCRDPELVGRFEFHNLPDGWADGTVVWWALYEGGSFEDGVLMADAYTDNEDADLIGTATVGNVDYSFELRGDPQTPSCEPENAQMPIVALNSPIVAAVQVVSTGRVCTVRYPEAVVVCNG